MTRNKIAVGENLELEKVRRFEHGSIHYYLFEHPVPYEQLVVPEDCFRIGLRLRPGTRFNFQLLGSESQQANEFDLPLCVAPGISLKGWGDAGDEHIILLKFSAEHFTRITGQRAQFRPSELRAMLGVNDRNVIRSMERLADELCNCDRVSDIAIESLVNSLIVDLYRYIMHADAAQSRIEGQLASHYRRMIEVRVLQDGPAPTVADLAGLCSISSRQLIRVFKRSTGMTLYEYVEQVRLKRAKEMLSTTDLPLKEISFRLGFSAPSSFSIAFRRLTGNSPRVYRRTSKLVPIAPMLPDQSGMDSGPSYVIF